MRHVEIFCDGSGTTAKNPCGFAAILRHGDHETEITGSLDFGTNNTAELMGAIIGLEALTKPCRVTVYSDSQYVVNGATDGWGKAIARKPSRPNQVYWARLFEAVDKRGHNVVFKWIRGHNGHTENTRCDKLANFARKVHALLK